jgi:hypothetical protein
MRGYLRVRLSTLAFGLGLLGQVALASAQDTLDFQWRAPEGCPSPSEVRKDIDGLLGGAAGERVRQNLSVHATVEHGVRWLVTLETRSRTATGHRTLEAVSCQALGSATALIVALIIDPDAVAAHAKQAKAPEPSPLPVAAPAPSASPSSVEEASPVARATFVLAGLGAAGTIGVLPGPDLDLTATLGLARGPWRAELRAAYGLVNVSSDPLSQASSAYARFRFLAGTLAGCWMVSRAVVELGPCVDVELGAVRGEGVGPLEVDSKDTPWFGLGAGGVLIFKATSWLQFPVHADAVVPLWRPNYVFRHADSPLFRSWPVGGRLSAGIEARF